MSYPQRFNVFVFRILKKEDVMKKVIVFLTGALFLIVAVTAFAEEKPELVQKPRGRSVNNPAQATTTAKVNTQLQKKDLIDSISQTLDSNAEVIPNIANLKMVKEGDKTSYTFKEVRLENLDDASLQDLANKILGEVGKIQSEAINEQLDAARQAQQIQTQLNQTRQVQTQLNQAQQAQTATRQAAQIQSIPRTPSVPAAVSERK